MTTFIKVKLKKSDDWTNIDKYRVPANIIEYHINILKNRRSKLRDDQSIDSFKRI